MLWKIVFGVVLAIAHQFCYCDEHTYGNLNPGDKVLFEKVLFDQVKDEGFARSKNYTLIFKYIGSETSTNISHASFNVKNAKSYGTIEPNVDGGKEKTLQVMLNIVNGTNAIVTGRISGPSVSVLSGSMLQQLGKASKRTAPKTMTVVYGHNSTRTRDRKIILGHRQQGDKLLQFEAKNVTFAYRFAEAEFKYTNDKQSFTAVTFSFDTSSAIAFLNSTFIDEHRINAIVYDLNYPIFQANMSVYGYDHFDKPSTYVPIVLSHKNPA